jgi:hypothetical protein
MKLKIVIALVIAVLCLYFFKSRSSQNSNFIDNKAEVINKFQKSNEENSVTEKIISSRLENIQTVSKNTSEKQPIEDVSSLNKVLPADQDNTIESKSVKMTSKDGVKTVLNLEGKTLADAKIIVARNDDLNPSDEFNNLESADFSDPTSRLLSGFFSDVEAQIDLSLVYAPSKNALYQASCFYDGDKEFYGDDGLSLKDDKTGYAVLRVRPNTFVRLKFAFDPERLIYGKVFKKKGDLWIQEKEFTASEVSGKLKNCYKSKYNEFNSP